MKYIKYVVFVFFIIIAYNVFKSEDKPTKKLTEVEYFKENKKQVMSVLDYYLVKLKFRELEAILVKYKDVKDSDLEDFKAKIKLRKEETKDERANLIIEQLKSTPPDEIELCYTYYKELVDIYPKNKKYIEKMNYYNEKKVKEEAKKVFFGDKPVKNNHDGSYSEVKKYLQQNMHNPDSLDFIGCTEVYVLENKGWLVGCQFRGSNTFGATVLNSKWFTIRQNQVINVEDINTYKM